MRVHRFSLSIETVKNFDMMQLTFYTEEFRIIQQTGKSYLMGGFTGLIRSSLVVERLATNVPITMVWFKYGSHRDAENPRRVNYGTKLSLTGESVITKSVSQYRDFAWNRQGVLRLMRPFTRRSFEPHGIGDVPLTTFLFFSHVRGSFQ